MPKLLPKSELREDSEFFEADDSPTTCLTEARILARYCVPLFSTYVLQKSVVLTSILAAGYLGKDEIGAVSLANVTANITGYAIYQGLATALDTLCPQAYGSGNKKLVGLFIQRAILLLWIITIPIAILWAFSGKILASLLLQEERHVASTAGHLLQMLILGAPAYGFVECAQRYLQVQGRPEGMTYVLACISPVNVFLHWLFVWRLGFGVMGCGIAVVITYYLMVLLLLLYIRLFASLDCWPGLSSQAFIDWNPVVRLAIPGVVMILADYIAFEILSIASARLSGAHLAASTILQFTGMMAFQLPFSFSIGASTRIGILIGEGRPQAAKTSSKVVIYLGMCLGIIEMTFLAAFRWQLPRLFTEDSQVVHLVACCLPVNAAFQLANALAAQCNGLLKGLGRQKIAGYIHLAAFFGLAIPVSLFLCFGLGWELPGLWSGPAVGLTFVAAGESWVVYRTSYEKASIEAAERNERALGGFLRDRAHQATGKGMEDRRDMDIKQVLLSNSWNSGEMSHRSSISFETTSTDDSGSDLM